MKKGILVLWGRKGGNLRLSSRKGSSFVDSDENPSLKDSTKTKEERSKPGQEKSRRQRSSIQDHLQKNCGRKGEDHLTP